MGSPLDRANPWRVRPQEPGTVWCQRLSDGIIRENSEVSSQGEDEPEFEPTRGVKVSGLRCGKAVDEVR